MIVDPVTTRWTGALFNLAKQGGVLEEVARDVQRIGIELASPAVREFLLSAKVPRTERLAKLAPLFAEFEPLTVNFVKLLFAKNREEVLAELNGAFEQRMLVDAGTLRGVVESARKLDAAEITILSEAMGARLAKIVRLENRINPDLIGGVRVIVGANMIDTTVQGRLESLRRRLLEAPLPAV
ncbi:MAG: ATP synthase F1 subunit delta [Planctomycetota bacterium]|nr:MAG: ATP synthase F1 subunit delta [Planctomycetota bacterium]